VTIQVKIELDIKEIMRQLGLDEMRWRQLNMVPKPVTNKQHTYPYYSGKEVKKAITLSR
jgi:hypothetical protein